jgi:hypothetical protein
MSLNTIWDGVSSNKVAEVLERCEQVMKLAHQALKIVKILSGLHFAKSKLLGFKRPLSNFNRFFRDFPQVVLICVHLEILSILTVGPPHPFDASVHYAFALGFQFLEALLSARNPTVQFGKAL